MEDGDPMIIITAMDGVQMIIMVGIIPTTIIQIMVGVKVGVKITIKEITIVIMDGEILEIMGGEMIFEIYIC